MYRQFSLDDWSYNPDLAKNCKVDLVEILSDFSKYMDIEVAHLVKVNGLTCIFDREEIKCRIPADNLYRFSHKIPAYRFQGGELEMVIEGMLELDQQALPDYMIEDVGTCILTDFTCGEQLPSFKSCSEDTILMSSWSPQDFVPGQVWAVYFGKDCMPREYVRISNVISENQVCVTFLEPLPFLDHEIEWLGQDLPITCGIFKKGEIWAIYKGWNTNWRMSDYENYQCLIVHILSNISEEDGIRISVLEELLEYLGLASWEYQKTLGIWNQMPCLCLQADSSLQPCRIAAMPKDKVLGFRSDRESLSTSTKIPDRYNSTPPLSHATP
ncbi:hypothetical protein Tsubulata_039892 [Turnera subulata]|uniref:DUF3444 domain-containing protein n=1 Tax=Turnera subulata TaxID=218843 RepID=A0A9Q0FTK2_9ROSI|nr:hypothetical protein Tsubulata_039892 [Turnera subulata]